MASTTLTAPVTKTVTQFALMVLACARRHGPGGTGGKTRVILLPAGLWLLLLELRGEPASDAPVFRSAKVARSIPRKCIGS